MPALTDEQSTSIPDEESAAVGSAQSSEQAQPLPGKDDDEPKRASISRNKRAMWTLLFTCVFAVGIAIGVVLIRNSPPSSEPSRSSGETDSILSDEVDGAGGVPSSHPTRSLAPSSAMDSLVPSLVASEVPDETTGELVPHADVPAVNGTSTEQVEEGTVTSTDSDVISSELIDAFNQITSDAKNDYDHEAIFAADKRSDAPSSSPDVETGDSGQVSRNACLSEQACDAQRQALGFQYYTIGDL